MKQLRRPIQLSYHGVYTAIVIEIREGDAAVLSGELKGGACRGRYVRESGAAHVAKDPIRQRGIAPDEFPQLGEMCRCEENVLPAVVIEVVDAEAPSGQLPCGQQ